MIKRFTIALYNFSKPTFVRKVLFTLLSLFCFVLVYSQSDSTGRAICQTPAQCSLNFITPLYGNGKIDSLTFNYAKIGSVPKFHDVRYSAETCDTIPLNTYCEDDTTVLRCHVYYPDTSVVNYGSCKLPAIVLFHAGGFLDCGGTFDGPDFIAICRQFARRGFVVFDVEYRRGVLVQSNTIYSAQQLLGIYRAAQDGRGFMRSMIKQARLGTSIYRIDTTEIFVGGASAGSVVAMSIAYFSKQSMFDAVYPGISTSTILGGIDPTFYFGDTTIKYHIRGVLDMWGGLAIPPNYLSNPENFFSQNDSMPPLIGFHGLKDPTFKYNCKKVTFAKDALISGKNYGREGNCLLGSTDYILHPSGNADGYLLGA